MTLTRLALASLCLALTPACASTGGGGAPPSEEQMMERWMAFMTPGAAHQVLAPKVGSWNLVVRMFMAPGAPPEESTGTSVVQWTMDGRYLQDTTTGVFNGQPFRGSGLTGYDNLKHCYVFTWIDNFGTGILYGEGSYDPATKTLNFRSESPDLVFTNGYVSTRSTEQWIDDDHWVMRSYAPDQDGEEYLAMEIAYARAR